MRRDRGFPDRDRGRPKPADPDASRRRVARIDSSRRVAGIRTKVEQKRCELCGRRLSLVAGGGSRAADLHPLRMPGRAQRCSGFAVAPPPLRGPPPPKSGEAVPPFPSCSPRIPATAAGSGSCWRSSAAASRCCGCRTGWRSSKAGGSIRPGCRRHDLIHVEARDARDALWAMEEGLRCSGLSAVIGEMWGDPRALDFTATRRLAVAAERSGVPCWLMRLGGTRQSQRRADALADRERAVAGQRARSARAGLPAWDAELFRARGMPPGRWTHRA